ncbi:unnamed protein product, partial [marine sediment metagenome]
TKRDKKNRIAEIEDGIDRYFKEFDEGKVIFLDDFKRFILWLRDQGYANLTIKNYVGTVKVFFSLNDERFTLTAKDWRQIKRTLMPKSTRAQTLDEILTIDQLKVLLLHMSVHLKAMKLTMMGFVNSSPYRVIWYGFATYWMSTVTVFSVT